MLNDFNQDTVFDYFAIVGIDNTQICRLITKVKLDVMAAKNVISAEEKKFDFKRQESSDSSDNDENGPDISRHLKAGVLERYPNIDRPSVAFPTELVNFFFNKNEKLYTEQ
jgi:hypothetical protein